MEKLNEYEPVRKWHVGPSSFEKTEAPDYNEPPPKKKRGQTSKPSFSKGSNANLDLKTSGKSLPKFA